MNKFVGKILFVVALLFMLLSVTANADYIPIEVNGKIISADTSCIIRNGRILVPVRSVFETLDCDVSYREEADGGYVYIVRDDNIVVHKIGSDSLFTNGETCFFDTCSEITGGVTYVPLRALSESLGLEVEWNSAERKTVIKK